MSASLDAIDCLAATEAEQARRSAEWDRMRRAAANRTDAARIATQAQGDLAIWTDIWIFFRYRLPPRDGSHAMARSARVTLDRMRESGKASDDQVIALYAITRALENHVGHRHGWDKPEAARQAA